MTKWFDTNYHYIVPEIGPDTTFSLHPDKVLNELKEAQAQGIPARPVLIGPITFLALSKAVDGAGSPIGRLDELVALYGELLGLLADAGADWVQLDEPIAGDRHLANAAELAERVYTTLASAAHRPAIFVATYFGAPGGALAGPGPHSGRGDRGRSGGGPVSRRSLRFPSLAHKLWWPVSSTGAISGAPTWRLH